MSVTKRLTLTADDFEFERETPYPFKTTNDANNEQEVVMEVGDFTKPKKTNKLVNIIENTPTTPTKNRYETLRHLEEKENKNSQFTIRKPKSERFCPPIVIQGKPKSHTELVKEINRHVTKGYYIKYAPKSILLYIKDVSEYKQYKNKLTESEEMQFHTYTTKTDKRHAFVLKGLEAVTTTEEIRDELIEEYGIDVVNIFKMKTTRNPLYLVITDNETTLKQLQNKVRYLMHTKITWERRINERLITQCRRCQAWGHATSNCHRNPRCVKCADGHYTKECQKPVTEPAKCANCAGSHTACNTVCPVYISRVEALEKNRIQAAAKDNFKIAPPPAVNAWTTRNNARNSVPQTNQTLSPQTFSSPERGGDPRDRQQGSSGDHMSDFNSLMDELTKLNSLININETVKAIAVLNQMLQNSKNPLDTINILQNFASNILPKYNVQNSR